jgi:predicted Zn-dependent protease
MNNLDRIRFKWSLALISAGRYKKALNILLKLKNKYPQSIKLDVLKADIILFQKEYVTAYQEYHEAVKKIDVNQTSLSKEDNRFIQAYINYRKTAILNAIGEAKYDKFHELAQKVNELPARTAWKELFTLSIPEKIIS